MEAEAGVPTVVFAGEEYRTDSSRDRAAKRTMLRGIRCVIAKSFERVHRRNLVGTGVVPLQFGGSDSLQSLSSGDAGDGALAGRIRLPGLRRRGAHQLRARRSALLVVPRLLVPVPPDQRHPLRGQQDAMWD